MANNIDKFIREKGIKVNFICEKAKVSRNHFLEIRKGNINPSIVTAKRIAEVLGVSIDELFG